MSLNVSSNTAEPFPALDVLRSNSIVSPMKSSYKCSSNPASFRMLHKDLSRASSSRILWGSPMRMRASK